LIPPFLGKFSWWLFEPYQFWLVFCLFFISSCHFLYLLLWTDSQGSVLCLFCPQCFLSQDTLSLLEFHISMYDDYASFPRGSQVQLSLNPQPWNSYQTDCITLPIKLVPSVVQRAPRSKLSTATSALYLHTSLFLIWTISITLYLVLLRSSILLSYLFSVMLLKPLLWIIKYVQILRLSLPAEYSIGELSQTQIYLTNVRLKTNILAPLPAFSLILTKLYYLKNHSMFSFKS
jgi:hypothetical protein